MGAHRAVLIQDIKEYTNILKPYINEVLHECSYTGIDFETMLEWIIAEELELIYGLLSSPLFDVSR